MKRRYKMVLEKGTATKAGVIHLTRLWRYKFPHNLTFAFDNLIQPSFYFFIFQFFYLFFLVFRFFNLHLLFTDKFVYKNVWLFQKCLKMLKNKNRWFVIVCCNFLSLFFFFSHQRRFFDHQTDETKRNELCNRNVIRSQTACCR